MSPRRPLRAAVRIAALRPTPADRPPAGWDAEEWAEFKRANAPGCDARSIDECPSYAFDDEARDEMERQDGAA